MRVDDIPVLALGLDRVPRGDLQSRGGRKRQIAVTLDPGDPFESLEHPPTVIADTHSMDLPAPPGGEGSSDSLLHSELARLRTHLELYHADMGGGSASIGDVAQETAARVLERKGELEFESRGALRAYLWRTAKRLLVDRWRRRDRKQSLEVFETLASGLAAGPPLSIPDGRTEDLLKALQKLSFPDRRVLELAYLHDATVGDIATELGISVAAVKMRLSRARERLRERLGLD